MGLTTHGTATTPIRISRHSTVSNRAITAYPHPWRDTGTTTRTERSFVTFRARLLPFPPIKGLTTLCAFQLHATSWFAMFLQMLDVIFLEREIARAIVLFLLVLVVNNLFNCQQPLELVLHDYSMF